jgi:hypothetical protein
VEQAEADAATQIIGWADGLAKSERASRLEELLEASIEKVQRQRHGRNALRMIRGGKR